MTPARRAEKGNSTAPKVTRPRPRVTHATHFFQCVKIKTSQCFWKPTASKPKRNTNFENDYSGYGHLIITLDEHSYSPADPDSLWPRTITFYLEDENTLTKRYFVYLQQPYDGYADYGPGFDKQGVQELIGTSDLTKEGELSGVS